MPKMAKWKPVPIDNVQVLSNIEGLVGIEILEDKSVRVVKGKNNKRKNKSLLEAPSKKRKKDLIPNKNNVRKEKAKKIGLWKEEDVSPNDSILKINKKLKEVKCKSDGKNDVKHQGVQKAQLDNNEKSFLDDMTRWKKFGLKLELLKALHDKGFFIPTKIQESCIGAAMTSKKSDIIGAAETGSGKTFAYGMPVVQEIMKIKEGSSTDENADKLMALVVTPTRELAVQVKEQLTLLCKNTDINVALVVGGLAKEKQYRLLKRRPEIVVGTPGRIWELFNEGIEHLNAIPRVRMLVVDEADRMLEQKHFAELGELLEKMNADSELKTNRRNFVFSATLTFVHDPPTYHQGKKKRPKQKLDDLLNKIGVKNKIVYDQSCEKLTPESLSEYKINCQFSEKDYYLLYFLRSNPDRTIIFCNSIGCVRRLANLLNIIKMKPLPLHANMEQKQRLRNLEKFRETPNSLLLATDVAARGLDIPQVGHVVHYQVPRTAESYVHRSGRTARQSQQGASLLLVSVQEIRDYNKLMKSLRRAHGVEDLEVLDSELQQVKQIVNVARDIDVLSLALRRNTSSKMWYEKSIEEMDILVDEDEMPEQSKATDLAVRKAKKDISLKEKQLQRILSAPFGRVYR